MAKRIETILIDDVTGGHADDTVTFGLDGATYEIDLSAENAASMRDTLRLYVEKGRRTGGRLNGRPALVKGSGPAKLDPAQRKAMRDWARANGWPNLSDRGRIPAEAQEAYHTAHPQERHLQSA